MRRASRLILRSLLGVTLLMAGVSTGTAQAATFDAFTDFQTVSNTPREHLELLVDWGHQRRQLRGQHCADDRSILR